MAVALRAAGSAVEDTASPSLPGGTVAGDLILVIVHQTNTATTAAASGYTQLGTYVDSGSNSRSTVLWRISTGSDGITLTNTGTHYVVYVSSYSGTDATTPISAATSAQPPDGGPYTCPTVTAAQAGSYLVCHVGTGTYGGVGPVTWTPPGGMTERVDYSGTASTFPYANTDADLAGVSGATGTKTFTPTATSLGPAVALSLILAPPGASSTNAIPAVML